jgi:hypothetical protein
LLVNNGTVQECGDFHDEMRIRCRLLCSMARWSGQTKTGVTRRRGKAEGHPESRDKKRYSTSKSKRYLRWLVEGSSTYYLYAFVEVVALFETCV